MDIDKAIATATEHYLSGKLQQAELICREILGIQPVNADALYLLGLLYLQLGEHHLAIENIKKSLHLNPNNADAYNHLGSALKANGNLDEAIIFFQKATKIYPDLPEAYFNLANTFIMKGQLDEAVLLYKKAIKINPYFFAAYYNLGKSFQEKGNPDEAIGFYQKALELNPNAANVYNDLGIIFQEKGQVDTALLYYQKSITLNPYLAGAYGNIGKIFQEKRSLDEALIYYQKVLHLSSDNDVLFNAYNNMGVIYQEKGESHKAIACYQRALQINSSLPGIYKNLGTVFHQLGLYDDAMSYSQRALEINPDDPETYSNLGSILVDKGQIDEAFIFYQKALQINPDFIDAHWNISLAELLSGNFLQGWKNYEWRFLKEGSKYSAFPQPQWDGRSLHGKTIIVFAEQGVGDEIMFASCLPEIIAQAGLCIIECDKRLIPLFSRSFAKSMVIGRLDIGAPYPENLPLAEMKISIGSLPKFLRPNLSSFPQQSAYLTPDDKSVENWRKRFSELGSGFKIGISWRGGSKPAEKLARSTVLEQWKNLFSVPGVHFVNLQYGNCTTELMEVREKLGITIHDWEDADPLKDLEDFAAQIAALDLVISVDNATVHMAGALGVPVWVLLPFSCDWRWMRDFEDTPWYKTVRLIRKSTVGDWDEVFEQAASYLRQYASTGTMYNIKCSYRDSIKTTTKMLQ